MARAGWIGAGQRVSVGVLGVLLLAVTARHANATVVTTDTSVPLAVLRVSLPLAVGTGLLLAGVWLPRVLEPRRIWTVAAWTVGGGIVGVALVQWFVITRSLSPVFAGGSLSAYLNGAATIAVVGTFLGYYAAESSRRGTELETARARFQAVAEHSPFVVVAVDESGTIRYANDATSDVFGYAPDGLVGESVAILLGDRQATPGSRALARYFATGSSRYDTGASELTAVHADGTEFPVEVSVGEYDDGDTHHVVAVFRDISDRERAVARLEDHVRKVTRLHELAAVIARADDVETIYERAANGAVELFGCDAACVAAVEGQRFTPTTCAPREATADGANPIRPWYAQAAYESLQTVRVDYLQPPRDAPTADASAGEASAAADAEPYRSLLTVPIHGHGVLQLFAAEPEAFSDTDEEVASMLATHVGTACERVSAEETVRRERDRLEEFANVLSHDIRNPLTVARGRLELAKNAEHPEEHFPDLERAHDRMDRLIEDVLKLAREGEAVGETETVDLESVVRSAWNGVATRGATLRIVDDLGTIEADRSRLQEGFENLFRNAVEHGAVEESPTAGDDAEDGRETVTANADGKGNVMADAESPDGGHPVVTVGRTDRGFYVEDDGPGIPESTRERIFESGFSRSAEGTGFGLPIVKRIVEAHGWEIRATEGETGGARFEVSDVEFAPAERDDDD